LRNSYNVRLWRLRDTVFADDLELPCYCLLFDEVVLLAAWVVFAFVLYWWSECWCLHCCDVVLGLSVLVLGGFATHAHTHKSPFSPVHVLRGSSLQNCVTTKKRWLQRDFDCMPKMLQQGFMHCKYSYSKTILTVTHWSLTRLYIPQHIVFHHVLNTWKIP